MHFSDCLVVEKGFAGCECSWVLLTSERRLECSFWANSTTGACLSVFLCFDHEGFIPVLLKSPPSLGSCALFYWRVQKTHSGIFCSLSFWAHLIKAAVLSCSSIWDHIVHFFCTRIFQVWVCRPFCCKPWAVFGKGRLWKAGFKQSRMNLLCQLGLQMHPLNAVLQSGSTACNYSIRETTETIKRSWEQFFPLWPWPRSRMTKVILCEVWALLNLIVSLSSINLHYLKKIKCKQ